MNYDINDRLPLRLGPIATPKPVAGKDFVDITLPLSDFGVKWVDPQLAGMPSDMKHPSAPKPPLVFRRYAELGGPTPWPDRMALEAQYLRLCAAGPAGSSGDAAGAFFQRQSEELDRQRARLRKPVPQPGRAPTMVEALHQQYTRARPCPIVVGDWVESDMLGIDSARIESIRGDFAKLEDVRMRPGNLAAANKIQRLANLEHELTF